VQAARSTTALEVYSEFQASPTRPVNVYYDEDGHRMLLASRKTLTQTGIDVILQHSKETKLLSPSSESNLIVIFQKLVKETKGFPRRFDLAGVIVSGPATKARGGSADIYQGYIQGKSVCVKKIRRTQDTLDKVSKDISDEVILCGYLADHPNILPLLGVYREGAMQSLVYPWMESGDLASYLKRYPDSNRIQLLYDVSLGLQFLHERSIVHGDLKGTNILVNDYGRACIADFGLSSILPSWGGTPHYQAPELFGEAFNTKSTDIYAFGCLAYEVFTGKQPFSGNCNASVIMNKVSKGQRPKRPFSGSASRNFRGLTEDVWALIEACWTAHPMDRPAIDTVIQRLERALSDDKN
ncbi:hypothetical protein H0H92_005822, partial [Tricholoma furcatifolium]